MEIYELKALKEEHGMTNEQIAELSGIPYSTVTKIFSGATKRPGHEKLKAIERSIHRFILDESGELNLPNALNYGHTIEDYYSLPEDKRVELIDGVFYNMASPTVFHQRVSGLIYAIILFWIKGKGGKCLPLISPIDVQLDCDDKTMVQPDVVIVCDPDKVKDRVIYGAPDWVMEVVSKSSKKRDYIIKLQKYQNAGVREYWIVDGFQQRVLVYSNMDKGDEMSTTIYTFDDEVPVGIYEDLTIDMKEIKGFL